MIRTMTPTMVAVIAAAGLVAAQSSPQGGPPSAAPPAAQSSSAASSQSKPQTITYTGCLEAGATGGSYVLSGVTDSNAKTGGNAQANANSLEGQRFALAQPPASFNMASNVNHKVQITGTLGDAGAPSPATPPPSVPAVPPEPNAPPNAGNAGGGVSAQSPVANADATLRTITVRSVKVVGDRCGL